MFVTPHKGVRSVSGHVVVNVKWRNTKIGEDLKRAAEVVFSDGMGVVDFCVYDDCYVLYVPESELIVHFCTKKIDKFHKLQAHDKLVIAVRNSLTSQAFSTLQEYAAIKLDMPLLTIASCSELPTLLGHLAGVDTNSPNPFCQHQKAQLKTRESGSTVQLKLLAQVPSVGPKKAAALFRSFGSIRHISSQSEDSLAAVLGAGCAARVWQYFHKPLSSHSTPALIDSTKLL